MIELILHKRVIHYIFFTYIRHFTNGELSYTTFNFTYIYIYNENIMRTTLFLPVIAYPYV